MNPTLEEIVLALRYIYYVRGQSAMSDAAYDELERIARRLFPPESKVHQNGSDLEHSYSMRIKEIAQSIIDT